MTSRLENRLHFARIQHQFARSRRHRELLAFRSRLDEIVARATAPPPLAAPPRDASPGAEADARAEFDQAMRDLLVRVHERPPLTEDGPMVARATAPPPPRDASPRAEADARAEFDQAMRDLLVRVHGPLTPDENWDNRWWSPQPAYGYRIWQLRDDKFHGTRLPWPIPQKTARCLHRWTGDGPVPHDVVDCGSPPCGIYAMKEPAQVRRFAEPGTRSMTVAVGAVALTGRVIEHELGYRAQHADVVAAAVFSGNRRLLWFTWVEEPLDLADLFGQPAAYLAKVPVDLYPPRDALDAAFDRITSKVAVLSG